MKQQQSNLLVKCFLFTADNILVTDTYHCAWQRLAFTFDP